MKYRGRRLATTSSHFVALLESVAFRFNDQRKNMKKFKSWAALIALSMTGCVHQTSPQASAYDPTTDARIRVYFGVSTHFYFNTACEPRRGALGYGGGGGLAVAKPRNLNLANTTIGMPVPEDAYRYYDEYVIKANQPMTITLDTGRWSQVNGFVITETRRHVAGSFMPRPGVDYEAFSRGDKGGLELTIRQLRLEDERVQTERVTVDYAPRCQ